MITQFMRSQLWQAILGLSLLSSAPLQAASFVYEGQLDDRGAPANGRYDVQLAVYRDAELGATLAAPTVFNAVEVSNGRFRLDFDAQIESAESAWVELAVRDAGAGNFSAIPGRTKATQAPAAIGACWSSVGDSGSNPATNFLGTTDAQPLVLRTANAPSLRIEPSSVLSGGLPITTNTIGGSHANAVTAGVRGATIAGGGVPSGDSDPNLTFEAPNRVTDAYGTVGGGYGNVAGDAGGTTTDHPFATVGGGNLNEASGLNSTVGGGYVNVASGGYSSVGGGYNNSAPGEDAVIAGGNGNTTGGNGSTIGGGLNNLASGNSSTVSGGQFNTASADSSTVSGGRFNCAGGSFSWAGGKTARVRPGTGSGAAGSGCGGVALSGDVDGDSGTFVWSDDSGGSYFTSTGDDQFLVRAAGGVAINTNIPEVGAALTVNGDTSTTGNVSFGSSTRQMLNLWGPASYGIGIQSSTLYARVASNSGFAWFEGGVHSNVQNDPGVGGSLHMTLSNTGQLRTTTGTISALSDARLKTDISDYTGALDQISALHPVHYRYREAGKAAFQPPGEHLGFIAQEVQTVFPQWVTRDDEGYLNLSLRGFEAVAVRAIQELDAKYAVELATMQAENAALRGDNQAIRQELAELRTLIETQRTQDR